MWERDEHGFLTAEAVLLKEWIGRIECAYSVPCLCDKVTA